MKPAIPDTNFINEIATICENISENILKDCECVRDEKKDIFMRYMAYCRLSTIVKTINFSLNLNEECLSSGHLISHDILQTKEARKNGWNIIDPKDHEFFDHTEENKEILENLVDRISLKNKTH